MPWTPVSLATRRLPSSAAPSFWATGLAGAHEKVATGCRRHPRRKLMVDLPDSRNALQFRSRLQLTRNSCASAKPLPPIAFDDLTLAPSAPREERSPRPDCSSSFRRYRPVVSTTRLTTIPPTMQGMGAQRKRFTKAITVAQDTVTHCVHQRMMPDSRPRLDPRRR